MRSWLALSALLLTACPSGDGNEDTDKTGDTDTDTQTGDERAFTDFVDVETNYVAGDTSCYAGTLGTETPDPTCVTEAEVSGVVEDFQEGEGVPDITVQVWNDDDISGSASATTQADESGNFSTTIPVCQPFGYGTSTPPEWEETKDTYEVHQIYGPGVDDVVFNSVSFATSRLIPGLIGVEWDESTGIIAGAVYDCNEDPVQYAQVFFHDGSGAVPSVGDVFYFSITGDTELPTSRENQAYTNTNGLWVAVNVPAGDWQVEAYGWDGSQHVMLGATQLTIKAGSVNISNIYMGISDGLSYPDSCKTPCE
ncbi:MAG: hypothetical protein ACOZNI_04840 [Myxococcota bacterium]